MNPESWVAVALVARPHALRGAVLLKTLVGTPEEFAEAPLERVFLRRRGLVEEQPLKIARMAIHKGMPYVFFDGVTDRNAAERLLGAELVIPREELWEPAEDDEDGYRAEELEGLDLVDEQTGTSFGPVLRWQEGAAHDYLVFENPRRPGTEVLLPFVDEFVKTIDPEARRATVRLPEGLLDL